MNKQKSRVVAVVLTHNRKKLLLRVLDGLFRQSHSLEKIIIIDSLSTDGTYETLQKEGVISRSDVQYIWLDENKGPSGGFAEGIDYAMKEGCEWVWILDDDISPQEDCLEFLLECRDISRCIAPYREGKTVPFFNPAIGIVSHNKSLSFDKGKELIFTNTCCFEGMLLHADLINKIGVPDERFFQVYGDTIYGFVSSIYTNVVHVKKAIMHRMLPDKKPITSRRVYLLVRNQFLVKEYLKEYDILRPGFYTLSFVMIVLYYSIVMPIKTRSPGMPFAVIKGVMHGLMGRFGPPG